MSEKILNGVEKASNRALDIGKNTRAPMEGCIALGGRTPLIRAPIGFYAKVRLLKARFEGEAAIF